MILVEWADAKQKQYRAATARFTSAADCAIAPNVHYPARVINPGGVARFIWKTGSAQGAVTSASVGAIILANADGGLDALMNEAFDGRPIRVLEGPATAKRRDQFVTLISGTLAGVLVKGQEVTLRVRDRVAQIEGEIAQNIRYLGNNALPAGVEGVADDWKGKPKPWLVGDCENIAVPCVNTSILVYQISSKAISELVSVWSNGASIGLGVQRASLAILLATAPTAGTFDWCLGDNAVKEGAYFRLGSSPANASVTCHAREGGNAGERTAAQVARRLMLAAPGLSDGDISSAALSTLDAVQSDSCGWWFGPEDGQTLGKALDAVLACVGAGWTPRRDGIFAPARLDDPAGKEFVAKYSALDILSLTAYAAGATNEGLPSYEIALDWGRNWTVQQAAQTAGSISDARRTFLGLGYRTVTVNDASIWDPVSVSGRNPLSQPMRHVTQLRTEANAQAEATRLLKLFGAARLMIDMVLPRTLVSSVVDLGVVVRVSHPRFGLALGKQFVVTAMDEDWSAGTVRIEGWG